MCIIMVRSTTCLSTTLQEKEKEISIPYSYSSALNILE